MLRLTSHYVLLEKLILLLSEFEVIGFARRISWWEFKFRHSHVNQGNSAYDKTNSACNQLIEAQP